MIQGGQDWQTLQAARGTSEQGILGNLLDQGILNIVPPIRDEQGILANEDCVELAASENESTFFPYSLSVSPSDILNLQSGGNVQYELETGDCDDALYINDVNDVACTVLKCNKRISCAG